MLFSSFSSSSWSSSSPQAASRRLVDLFLHGNDERAAPEARTGLNRYGCAPWARPGVLELGSCSGSSPEPGWAQALAPRLAEFESAISRGREAEWTAAVNDEIRRSLCEASGLAEEPDLETVLTPSGTDAQLLVAALGLAADDRPVLAIVVGPDELGAGSSLAMRGRHFGKLTPHARGTAYGEPLAGMPAARLEAAHIALRDGEGLPLSRHAVEEHVDAALAGAAARGRRVLLHVVAHSKTGIHSPSLAAIDAWRSRHPGLVDVVVDAAQGRMDRTDLRDWVRRGFLVVLTGSKFFGGPSFSGAVLVPGGRRRLRVGVLPGGLGNYLSRADLPRDASRLVAGWPCRANPGLTFRWLAALESIRAYSAVPAELLDEVKEAFAERVVATFRGARHVDCEVLAPELTSLTGDGGPQTVFCLSLRTPGREIGPAGLEDVHAALNAAPAGAAFHLGRPLTLGHGPDGPRGALRLALGAPLAVRLATDPQLGTGMGDRLAWLTERLEELRTALEALASR